MTSACESAVRTRYRSATCAFVDVPIQNWHVAERSPRGRTEVPEVGWLDLIGLAQAARPIAQKGKNRRK